jgi:hypothetical protein
MQTLPNSSEDLRAAYNISPATPTKYDAAKTAATAGNIHAIRRIEAFMDRIPPSVDTHVPSGPNFSLVVAVAFILLFAILLAAYFFLHHAAHKLMPTSQSAPTALILR